MVTLYKRDKKGKLMEWTIDYNDVSYWTGSGYVNGKITVTEPTFVEQKNVGKVNETSLEQQVLNEVNSKIQYQIDHGYSIEIPGEEKRFEVSLADKYPDRQEKGKLEFPYISETKLDGLRCYIQLIDNKVVMKSRAHKEFVSCPHIKHNPFVKKFFETYPDAILDGELYNHELKNDFNKIVSLVKKVKLKESDLEEAEAMVEYHCFDAYFPSEPDMTYVERKCRVAGVVSQLKGMETLFNETKVSYDSVEIVGIQCVQNKDGEKVWWMNLVNTEEEADSFLDKAIAAGYEGIMLKKNVPYFFGRSFDMLKYKRFMDAEYKIVDFEQGKGNLKGITAAVICVAENGTEFKAGVTGSQDYARDLYNNRESYVGKMATVKYQELTPIKDGKGGVPRFGKMTAIRDYEG